MSFFDDASLVMIPSGYKTSKVYSVKPTDGSGDLAFSRSNDTATRVGPDGLIEKVRTNLITYSEQFDNVVWTKGNSTITANDINSPIGTLTADKIVETASTSSHLLETVLATSIGQAYTLSCFFKKAERNFGYVGAFTDESKQVYVNLTTGAVTNTVGSIISSKVETYSNGWFRVSMTFAASAILYPFFGISDNGTNLSYTGNGTSGIYLWGAQVETGDIATDYIATTTAAVSVGPVANVPRLDYLDSSCPKLLLEPQRSSLVTFSEQLDNAAWTKNAATITANASVSPDGYTNADTLTESTFTSDSAFIYETVVVTPSTAYTTSVFVKQGAGRYVYLRNYYAAGNAYYTVVVDTQTGTITQASVGSSITNASSSIEAYGNGWYRVRATQTSAIEVAFLTVIGLSDIATPTVGTFGQITIASNAGRSASFWGYQLEAGAYATSYIPTTTAAVTRAADACSKTGISSLIGQTEGTLYGELKVTAYDPNGFIPVYLKNSAGSNEVYVWFQTDGRIRGRVYNASAAQADIVTAAGFATVGGTYKFALAYKQNDFAFYVNGQQIGTDTSGTVGATSEFYFTYAQLADFSFPLNIDQTLIFPTRLTNAQLAELTTI